MNLKNISNFEKNVFFFTFLKGLPRYNRVNFNIAIIDNCNFLMGSNQGYQYFLPILVAYNSFSI